LPEPGAVFLRQTLERRATGTTVHPDADLVARLRVLGGEVPEVQLARLVGVLADGHQAGVRLANVKVDLGHARAVDRERLGLVVEVDGLTRHRRGGKLVGHQARVALGNALVHILVVRVELADVLQATRAGLVDRHGGEQESGGKQLHLAAF
jgi:hypothetical protein